MVTILANSAMGLSALGDLVLMLGAFGAGLLVFGLIVSIALVWMFGLVAYAKDVRALG